MYAINRGILLRGRCLQTLWLNLPPSSELGGNMSSQSGLMEGIRG